MPNEHGEAYKGSQKWLQILVNDRPELLNREIAGRRRLREGDIRWLSPIRKDNFREYHDQAFIDRLEIKLDERPLKSFWPSRGPHWDGLGRTSQGQLLLVEAKSHIPEMRGQGSAATSLRSREMITGSLKDTEQFLNADLFVDWAKSPYYQCANRLAHLYLLRELNRLPAFLIMLYFLNDIEQGGPSAVSEWEIAIAEEEQALGIRPGHKLSDFIMSVFINVEHLSTV